MNKTTNIEVEDTLCIEIIHTRTRRYLHHTYIEILISLKLGTKILKETSGNVFFRD